MINTDKAVDAFVDAIEACYGKNMDGEREMVINMMKVMLRDLTTVAQMKVLADTEGPMQ